MVVVTLYNIGGKQDESQRERETYRDSDITKTLKIEREIFCGKEDVILNKRN